MAFDICSGGCYQLKMLTCWKYWEQNISDESFFADLLHLSDPAQEQKFGSSNL